MDRPVITGDSGLRDGEVWCAHHRGDILLACLTSLSAYLDEERGHAQLPTTLFLGKEGIALRKVDKEGLCSRSWCRRACRQSTALWPHPLALEHCIMEQFLWNVSANKGLVAGLRPCCLTWGTCVFHQPEQTPEPVLTASSTELFLKSCDSKEPKRLTEATS